MNRDIKKLIRFGQIIAGENTTSKTEQRKIPDYEAAIYPPTDERFSSLFDAVAAWTPSTDLSSAIDNFAEYCIKNDQHVVVEAAVECLKSDPVRLYRSLRSAIENILVFTSSDIIWLKEYACKQGAPAELIDEALWRFLRRIFEYLCWILAIEQLQLAGLDKGKMSRACWYLMKRHTSNKLRLRAIKVLQTGLFHLQTIAWQPNSAFGQIETEATTYVAWPEHATTVSDSYHAVFCKAADTLENWFSSTHLIRKVPKEWELLDDRTIRRWLDDMVMRGCLISNGKPRRGRRYMRKKL